MLERTELSIQTPLSASTESSDSSSTSRERQKTKVTNSFRTASSKLSSANASPSRQSSSTPAGSNTVSARLIDMGKRLIDAARAGQTESVRQLVVNSGAPFTSDWLGTTALHQAAQYGHLEIAEILLRGGVNRDARTKIERTALHLAAQSGSLEVVELLLSHGSEVNVRDMLKMTPLHWAVDRGHACIVERLLQAGADTNARSKFLLTPMDVAMNSDRYDIIDLLKMWKFKHTDSSSISCDIALGTGLCSNGIFDFTTKSSDSLALNATLNSLTGYFRGGIKESHDLFDVGYQLSHEETRTTDNGRHNPALDSVDETCIDLVELEWNSLKFEPEFFLSNPGVDDEDDGRRNDEDDEDEDEDIDDEEGSEPQKVDYLMKIVEELQKENKQLRQRVEQLSTSTGQ